MAGKNLDRWKDQVDAKVDKYTPTSLEVLKYPKMILPGEDCRRGEKRRGAPMESAVNLRGAIQKHYDNKSGKHFGLTIGLVFGKEVERREIVCIR